MSMRLLAFALTLVACGSVVEPGGSGGSAGAAGATGTSGAAGPAGAATGGSAVGGGSGSFAGEGGAASQPGYDRVMGCSAISHTATVVFYEPAALFRTTAISADGRVVAGHLANALSWTVEAGLQVLSTESNLLPRELSCDGSVALLHHPDTHSVWRVRRGEAAQQIVPESGQTSTPFALSPDGGTVVATLDGGGDLGPRPMIWTEPGALQTLEPLVNTLVHRVGDAGKWVVGRDVRRLYRYELGVGKTEPWPSLDPSSGGLFEPIVSGDGRAYAWREDSSSAFRVVRNGEQVRAPCPNGYCFPVDISGTGKVVAVYDVAGSWPRTLLFTDGGFKDLQALLEQNGVSLGARTLEVTAMSDDGQAFTGRSYDTETFEEKAFYATLPRAAYE